VDDAQKRLISAVESIDNGIRAGFTFLIVVIAVLYLAWAIGEDRERIEQLERLDRINPDVMETR